MVLRRQSPRSPIQHKRRKSERTDNEANRVVHLMPEGGFVQHAELPDSYTYVITTPGELIVENGVIVSAREAASDE